MKDKAKFVEKAECIRNIHEHFETDFNAVIRRPRPFVRSYLRIEKCLR